VLFQLSYIPMLTCGFASHHASWTVAQHSNSTIAARRSGNVGHPASTWSRRCA
jgi:hypothetical protein